MTEIEELRARLDVLEKAFAKHYHLYNLAYTQGYRSSEPVIPDDGLDVNGIPRRKKQEPRP